ncbi:hypothetical protein BDZ97DRAFT_323537 [Flammula alnicola]|nr:hypothetical protein BDZ97DRAFT_323537 [Flammula alnicola]
MKKRDIEEGVAEEPSIRKSCVAKPIVCSRPVLNWNVELALNRAHNTYVRVSLCAGIASPPRSIFQSSFGFLGSASNSLCHLRFDPIWILLVHSFVLFYPSRCVHFLIPTCRKFSSHRDKRTATGSTTNEQRSKEPRTMASYETISVFVPSAETL